MVVHQDRKEQILNNAVNIFSEYGYYKATTAMVAKAAGVTQPYVFHFFKSKEELFMAVIDRAFKKIYDTFSMVEAPAEQLMETMGHAFQQIMQTHREEIILVMQAHAIAEPAIRAHVSELFSTIYQALLEKFQLAGIQNPEEGAIQFIGTGLFITVSEVLDLNHLLCFNKPPNCP